jgi:hypothetical protein
MLATIISALLANGAWVIPIVFIVGLLALSYGLTERGNGITYHCFGKAHAPRDGDRLLDVRSMTRGTR